MKTHPDLPPFRWSLSAKVVVFPFGAQVGKIRRCAEVLERKRGRDADAYWRKVVQPMADRLAKAGIEKTAIHLEVEAFSLAVQKELQRRAWANNQLQRNSPDGAA